MGFFDFFRSKKSLEAPPNNGWQPIINEPFTGAWQRNQELRTTDVYSYHAVFACLSLISTDVGKLQFTVKKLRDGVWQDASSNKTRLLSRPNIFQTWQQFAENWVCSKLTRGNTYVFKLRDIFGDIYQLQVLNPDRVQPLVADNGEVFYQISRDKLFNMASDTIVPASEIIHDRYNCFYHPLVGLSPISACYASASQGIAIQQNATAFFNNASRPSGILSVPQAISREKATEIKAQWRENYSGLQQGGIAVLGDGAKYEGITITSADAQMIEQLRMTGEVVCSVFHVPAFKVGLGTIPAGQRVSDLNEIYYSDCLQHYIEAIENLLDRELELERGVQIEANLKSLIRMDSSSQIAYLRDGIAAGIFAPNEARAELGLAPVDGGNSPMIQQQNYSLAALARRDAHADPFSPQSDQSQPEPPASPAEQPPPQTLAKQSVLTSYKGVYSSDQSYQIGDFVTKNGSLWHCDVPCQGDFDHQDWTLAVKRGEADVLRDA